MNKFIAIFLLTIFSVCNIVVCYGAYKKGINSSVAVLEEDENHLEGLEVKKYIKSEFNPFELQDSFEYKSKQVISLKEKNYEDVYLNSIETPPDIVC